MKPWVILLCGLMVLSCSAGDGSKKSDPKQTKGLMNPVDQAKAAEFASKAGIPIPSGYNIIDLKVLNLDLDRDDEQLLLLQAKENPSMPIRLVVADFDGDRKTYFQAWDHELLARGNQPYTVELDDVVGEKTQEIIFSGFNDQGQRTLEVFRRTSTQGAFMLQYKTSFARATTGTMAFDRTPRNATGNPGQGASYDIVLEEDDTQSTNSLETLRTTFRFIFETETFEKFKTEKNVKTVLTDNRLLELLNSAQFDMEKFLSGPWQILSEDKKDSQSLFFDPAAKTISYLSGDTQEVYKWELTNRTFRSGLYIMGSNQIHNSIKLQMSISITSMETIQITLPDDSSSINGTYKRANTQIQGEGSPVSTSPTKAPLISGLFKNDRGMEINFDLPNFVLVENGVKTSGAGSIFKVNEDMVLQLKLFMEDGMKHEVRNYKMEIKESQSTGRMIRTILLYPARLVYTGVQVQKGDPLALEQQENHMEPKAP